LWHSNGKKGRTTDNGDKGCDGDNFSIHNGCS
jgi:hypothetical protein